MAVRFDAGLFFDLIRQDPFPGTLSQSQVDGITYVMRAWRAKYGFDRGDHRWLAYELASEHHETAFTHLPIKEYGSQSYLQSKPYYPYIGRGRIMITWLENYQKASDLTGEDLVNYPDLALQPEVAVQIMHDGMVNGWFTGHSLSDYFNDMVDDPVNARKIVNALDKAEQIADYHRAFLAAIQASLFPIP